MNGQLAIFAALGVAGCGAQGVCGEGTAQEGSLCVLAVDAGASTTCCGPGTRPEPGVLCVPVESRTCGACSAGTVTSGNVTECTVGDGCGPLACGNPAAGRVSLCGRLFDSQTGAPLWTASAYGMCVSAGGASTVGACRLEIRFLDAVELEAGNEVELTPASFRMSDCGIFAAEIEEPAGGAVAIVVDDLATLDPPVDDHVPATKILPAAAGLRRSDLIVHVVRRSTDALWTTGAGDPFAGQTFSQVGAHLMLFVRPGGLEDTPVAGVAVQGGQTFYFSDTDGQRASVDTDLTTTGVNGAALYVGDATPVASGAEPTGCSWPTPAISNIPGFVRVEHYFAENQIGDVCP